MNRALRRALSGVISSVVTIAVVTVGWSPAARAAQPADPGPAGRLPSAVPSTITPAVDDGRVFGIAQAGNTIVIGGSFTSVGGQSRPHVAAFDKTSGALAAFAPAVDGDVNQVIPGPTAGTVFLGGAFTNINGVAAQFVALLDLSTGAVVPSFRPPKFDFGHVEDLVLRGSNLYVAGGFTTVGGVQHQGLITLNALTGALDPAMDVQFTGHHNDSGSGAQALVGVTDIDVTPDGNTLVAIGNFKYANGLLRNQVAVVDLSGAAPRLADWATNRYAPLCFSWSFDQYVRGVSYSPDGSYFVITATGGGNPGTLCDAAARFETNLTDTNAEPTWIDQSGGDTLWGVTVTSTAIYLGGHNRWMNNPYGADHPLAGAVPRPGLEALDPITGRPFAWNPGHVPLGVSPFAFLATQDGVWMGSDFDYIGNHQYRRPKLAFFPYAGGYSPAPTTTADLPGTAYLAGVKTAASTNNVLFRLNAAGGAVPALDTGPDWLGDKTDPSPYRNSGSKTATYTPMAAESPSVPASTPNAIFNTERYSISDNPAMTWNFAVPAGTPIEVRLFFANRCSCSGAVGQRVFNVAIDGTTVLDHYDIVADVGNQTATMKAFDSTSDGTVNITFTHVTGNPLINGIEIVRTDRPAPALQPDTLSTAAFNGTTAVQSSANNQGIDFGSWRGAFLVGNTVYYGATDGMIHRRSFDGTTFGAPAFVNPYHDPVWANVATGAGDTFDGTFPNFYGLVTNLTGMAYWRGRLYYTLYKDSHLYSKWFLPDSSVVDETTVTQVSSVSFSSAAGLFIVNGSLYFGSSADGNLRRVSIATDGTVSGTATTVSGPALDGTNWFNRALFFYARQNAAPTASFAPVCSGLGCAFDASASIDPDGSIASYQWAFGDGTGGSGVAPTHDYVSAGTYTVTLTVTDNEGKTASVSHDVGVAATANVRFVAAADAGGGNVTTKQVTVPNAAVAGDTALLFLARTDTSTWAGPAGVSGWSQVGTFTTGSLTTTAWVKTLASADVGTTVSFTSATASHASLTVAVYEGVDPVDPVAGVAESGDASAQLHTTPLATAGTGDYGVSYWADRAGTGVTWTPPAELEGRTSSSDSGSLTIQALVADSGGSLPNGAYGGFTATTDSATAAAASWTLILNHEGVTNQPPHASFTSNCAELACSFDASASSDSDGTITYSWDFGDGSTAVGVTPSHTYGAPGTYAVILTVTDNGGAVDSVTHAVSLTTASPSVTFVGAANAGGGNRLSATAVLPVAAAAGDTALLFLSQTSTASLTGPIGIPAWTKVDSFTQGTLTTTAWVKKLLASDVGGGVTFTSPAYTHMSVDLAVYRGVNTTSPIAGFARGGDNGGTAHVTPALTVGAGTAIVSFWADRGTGPVVWTPPAGVIARESSPDTGATVTVQALLADSGGVVPAGNVGGLTATTDLATAKTTTWTIALDGT